MGARVCQTPDWPGFGPQKNRALDLATRDWVLSIDADERVTARLREQIEAAMRAPQFDAYTVNRRSSYCGQYMAHSGWYPDRHRAAVPARGGRFSDALVHEALKVKGPSANWMASCCTRAMRTSRQSWTR